jgi:subtilisin family serine protease
LDERPVPDLAAIPGVAELWELTLGDPFVRLALVDGPADLTHPCFEGAQIEILSPSWLPHEVQEAAPGAVAGRLEHGTWAASVLFGRHGSEIDGLAPECTGVLIPCFRGDIAELEPANVARAIDFAADAGANVLLVELCFPSRSGDVDDVLKRALRNAAQSGVLVVAGSGNEGAQRSCFPAASPDVLAVGAYDDDGRIFGFSNWGPEYEGHGLVAPGGNIDGALPGGGTKLHKGTSCSGPVVAGVAALLLSLQAQHGAEPDPPGIGRALLRTAAPCLAHETGGEARRCIAGRLDVAAATRLVLSQLRAKVRSPAAAAVGASGAVTVSADARVPDRGGAGIASSVFALGTLGYDFPSAARRDGFERFMADDGAGPANARDERRVLAHLAANPADARALTWTLNLDRTPIYALEPIGPYAAAIDERLVGLLLAQWASEDLARVERVSVPGRLTERAVELLCGEVVPVVALDVLRGLHGLNAAALADAATAHLPASGELGFAIRQALLEFLTRIYVDMANLGCTPAQRALNFAATNAYQAAESFAAALARGMVLDSFDTQRSAVCRADSDCWDVRLRFFDPHDGRRARRLFRFTVDVSDVTPVTLGDIRVWSESMAERAAA